MNHISPFVTNVMGIVSQVLKNGAQQVSQWTNHSVRFIQLIPQYMQQNSHAAIAVIATTNTAFFFAMRFIVDRLDKRLENQTQPLNSEQRTFKHIFLNGFILGGSVFSANLLLSKVTQYPLNKSIIATITTAVIAGRILLNQLEKYLARDEKPVVEKNLTKKASKPDHAAQKKTKEAQADTNILKNKATEKDSTVEKPTVDATKSKLIQVKQEEESLDLEWLFGDANESTVTLSDEVEKDESHTILPGKGKEPDDEFNDIFDAEDDFLDDNHTPSGDKEILALSKEDIETLKDKKSKKSLQQGRVLQIVRVRPQDSSYIPSLSEKIKCNVNWIQNICDDFFKNSILPTFWPTAKQNKVILTSVTIKQDDLVAEEDVEESKDDKSEKSPQQDGKHQIVMVKPKTFSYVSSFSEKSQLEDSDWLQNACDELLKQSFFPTFLPTAKKKKKVDDEKDSHLISYPSNSLEPHSFLTDTHFPKKQYDPLLSNLSWGYDYTLSPAVVNTFALTTLGISSFIPSFLEKANLNMSSYDQIVE